MKQIGVQSPSVKQCIDSNQKDAVKAIGCSEFKTKCEMHTKSRSENKKKPKIILLPGFKGP